MKLVKTETEEPDTFRPCSLRVQCKEFYVGEDSNPNDIFYKCNMLMNKVKHGLFEYNTDGLIFTPAQYGVGGNPGMVSGPLYKHTWDRSFKWKPAEFNTVDFLVRLKKDDNGRDYVGTEFEDGSRMTSGFTIAQYKTIILHCGFDERKHGYLNPFQQLLDGDFKRRENDPTNDDEEVKPESQYSAKPFMPTNPSDPKASLCNIRLSDDGGFMRTEEGDVFEENMIVEFRYDATKKGSWRWIPIRVRYDKTAEASSLCGTLSGKRMGFRRKKQSFGNDFATANNNWFSIHNPITEEMLTTGSDIPKDESVGEEVYYMRKTTETSTRALRDFHNLYVKMRLIGVAKRKDTLIDYAVGKAGDLSKWRAAKLSFVFGVDISKDNIMNREDGACSRYLTEASKYSGIFDAIFLHGNSTQNIRNGEAFQGFKEKTVTRAVFGEGAKDKDNLGMTPYKAYGIGKEGFNVSSCQFAIHYFFENVQTLHNFIRNVSECTRVGGYFVGTCWDGKKVFNLLNSKQCGDSYTLSSNGSKIFQITKMYDETAFPDDELSLGYSISVFQESIGQHIIEYLVNFNFLKRVMENYGFVLLGNEEARQFGFPSGTGMFENLFHEMKSHRTYDRNQFGAAAEMNGNEQFISFLNRYFIFVKVRNVETEAITNVINQKFPSSIKASRCIDPDRGVHIPVHYEMGEPEPSSPPTQKNPLTPLTPGKPLSPSTPESSSLPDKWFIRPIGESKVVIRTYDPPAVPQEVTNPPVDNTKEPIKLKPTTLKKKRLIINEKLN
jgi:hypothetical protein